MKSGNGFWKGCLYFWGFLFLLGLLVQYALPLAACVLLGYGGYHLYKRLRYPLLQDRSLDDRIELLKARIRQADKDIQQLELTLVEKGSESYKSLANQVLIELREIHLSYRIIGNLVNIKIKFCHGYSFVSNLFFTIFF